MRGSSLVGLSLALGLALPVSADVLVVDSSVVVHASHVLGGAASWSDCGKPTHDGADGGSALFVSGESLFFSSSNVLHGADGGSGGGHLGAGGDGGHGLIALEPSRIESLASVFTAGGPGSGTGCGLPKCDDGMPGIAIDGNVNVFAGEAATITSGQTAREGEPILIVVYGVPGERVSFDIAPNDDFRFEPQMRGVRLTRGGKRLAVGTVPPSGVMGVAIAAPYLAPGETSRRMYLQSLHRSPDGQVTLGSVRAIVVLDSAF